jgi:hypothetical protein
MNTLIVGKGNKKLKFAHVLGSRHECTNTMYFRSVDALQSWVKSNPFTKAVIIMQVDEEFLKIVRQNRHLSFILVMESLPSDDWYKYIDWIYFFDRDDVAPFIKKYFTRNEIVSVPIGMIRMLDKTNLNFHTSVYDYYNEY